MRICVAKGTATDDRRGGDEEGAGRIAVVTMVRGETGQVVGTECVR